MRLLGVLCLAVSSVVFGQTYTISTFAGGGPADSPATSVALNGAQAVASDSAGNLYIGTMDSILRLDASTGKVNRISSSGAVALALDASGNLYAATSGGTIVQKIVGGNASTFAGNGNLSAQVGSGLSPPVIVDGVPATNTWIGKASGLALDLAGNLYIADSVTHRIREVSNGIITTFAGSSTCTLFGSGAFEFIECPAGYSGDGGPATSARLSSPIGLAFDQSGNLYIGDVGSNHVRVVSNGVIGTVASGIAGFGITVEPTGSLLIGDNSRKWVQRLVNGVATTIAGTGATGGGGDGGPATAAQFNSVLGLALDGTGNIYVVDDVRIRKISGGIITTAVANGFRTFGGDGGPALSATLQSPAAVAVDNAGNLYIADTANSCVRKVSNGVITTVAGNGTGFSGDSGPAVDALLSSPVSVAVDSSGNLFIADFQAGRIRKVSNGLISTIAGNGTTGSSPDNTLATSGPVVANAVAVDSSGTVYFSEQLRVRKIVNGVLVTVAGSGTAGFSGDGGPATSAQLNRAVGIAFDAQDNLFIVDVNNFRVREVSNGIITTVIGNGKSDFAGDGGLATSAQGNFLYIAANADDLFVTNMIPTAGGNTFRVRRVSNSIIQTVAGNGVPGFSGDGGSAVNARFGAVNVVAFVGGLAIDRNGGLYVPDTANNRIRFLPPLPLFPIRNSASFVSNAVAPDTIEITEMAGISTQNITAPDGAWPTSLGGVTIHLEDTRGLTLFPLIANVSSGSVTYLIPPNTALGEANITLTTSTGATISGRTQINRIAPGIFSANSTGSGVAAGMWMRDTAVDNVQTTGYLFDPTLPVGQRYAIGFDPGPESDQVFLSLYGTGFHNANQVTANVGGLNVPVTGIAPLGTSAGEDAVTIGPLPRSLAGANIPIVLTFEGQQANTVTFSIMPTRGRPTARPPKGVVRGVR